MKNLARRFPQPDTIVTAAPLVPGEHIYIYYFKGVVDTRLEDLGQQYIGNWEEDDCCFLFFSAPAEKEISRFLKQQPAAALIDKFDMPYQEWQPMNAFPIEIGEFYIYPPWVSPPTAEDKTPLILDPGLVFGSGFHATTHDCLEALGLICYNDAIQKIETALDIGTGTGLLAVAAALRGVSRVIGVDKNFLAAKTARHNVSLNKVDDQVVVIKGSATEPAYRQTDLLMANIHYEVMETIIGSALFLNCHWFILSGLLRTPAEKIVTYLDKLSVDIIKIWNSDSIWYTILGKTGGLNEPG